jgi:transcriptional regulator with XRE-family HTH domain
MLLGSPKYKRRVRLKRKKSNSKRLLLLAAAVAAILVVIAVPVLAATNEDTRPADAVARLLGLNDAEALAEYLALEDEADEPCGPACSYYADNFAQAIGRGSAEELAEELELEGGEDELAQFLHDSESLNQLATALGLDGPEALAEDLGVERSVLAQALRTHQSQLETLAQLEELAESEGIEDEEEFDRLLRESSEDPRAFAGVLGFDSVRALAEELGITPRELRQLLRDASPEETNKLEELAELREIAADLGFANLKALADHLGVESRGELVKVLQDADTPQEVAEALGYETVGELAEDLGVDTDELDTLLDEAKSDDGVANTDGGDDEPTNSEGDRDSATGVSQQSEQEAESGEVNQSFSVTSEGDNSNQSAAVQGTANTGNAQSQTSVVQSGSEAENIEVEGGSSIEVSPEQVTQTQQEVEQAAAAAAEPEVPQPAAPAK